MDLQDFADFRVLLEMPLEVFHTLTKPHPLSTGRGWFGQLLTCCFETMPSGRPPSPGSASQPSLPASEQR